MDGLRYNDSIRKVEIYEKCFLSVVGHCCIMVCHGLWRNEMYSNASFLVVPESPIKCYQWPLWARKLHFRKSGPEKSAKKVLQSYPSIFPLRQFIAGAYLCCVLLEYILDSISQGYFKRCHVQFMCCTSRKWEKSINVNWKTGRWNIAHFSSYLCLALCGSKDPSWWSFFTLVRLLGYHKAKSIDAPTRAQGECAVSTQRHQSTSSFVPTTWWTC